jgi:predicted dehydrogenase
MPTTPFRWGFIGCGGIAEGFATGLLTLPDAELVAVAARAEEKATAFAEKYAQAADGPTPRALDDYQALVEQDDIDAVYIATTHHNHVTWARAAVAAGKAVLVEKPVGLHTDEVATLIDEAKAANVFLMEAMWMRFIPAFVDMLARLRDGVIGEPQLVQADFGIQHDWNPDERMLNPALGGGALWDLGIYPLTFARIIFDDDPEYIHTAWRPAADTGVDELSAYLASYSDGRIAQLSSGCRLRVPHQGRIYGPKGAIILDDFFHPHGYRIELHDQEPEVVSLPFDSSGYQYEAAEVQRCVRAGLLESPHCPTSETLGIIRDIDGIVQQWGLRYPRAT